jgi:hypothetical protein
MRRNLARHSLPLSALPSGLRKVAPSTRTDRNPSESRAFHVKKYVSATARESLPAPILAIPKGYPLCSACQPRGPSACTLSGMGWWRLRESVLKLGRGDIPMAEKGGIGGRLARSSRRQRAWPWPERVTDIGH